jgi:hypothetical protein
MGQADEDGVWDEIEIIVSRGNESGGYNWTRDEVSI